VLRTERRWVDERLKKDWTAGGRRLEVERADRGDEAAAKAGGDWRAHLWGVRNCRRAKQPTSREGSKWGIERATVLEVKRSSNGKMMQVVMAGCLPNASDAGPRRASRMREEKGVGRYLVRHIWLRAPCDTCAVQEEGAVTQLQK
jgi:hypothetical protein